LSRPETPDFPGLPRDADGPVFAEPWQAQAFAMTLKLHEAGLFTWAEWAEALGAERAADPDDGARYYEHWVTALEKLMAARGLPAQALAARKAAWADAYRRTPHGKPVVL
jgi:nitrile hydratase accessory protein